MSRYWRESSRDFIDASAMDELEQKCYDLDAKVRRVEDERDAVMNENDELQEQVAALRAVVESSSSSNANGGGSFLDESDREELVRLSEEVSRLDATQIVLRENYLVVQDKVKEVAAIKNSIKSVMEETACVKEDFLNLKNHLNLAAKIELQTNEKMYENRLHHLEKMLEEMRHREESFLHIAEETNILKDQVDSLRELSLTSLRDYQYQQPPNGVRMLQEHLSLNDELSSNNIATSTQLAAISCDPSPVTEQPKSSSSPPVRISGSLKLNMASAQVIRDQRKPPGVDGALTTAKKDNREEDVIKFNCCSDLMAHLWAQFFD